MSSTRTTTGPRGAAAPRRAGATGLATATALGLLLTACSASIAAPPNAPVDPPVGQPADPVLLDWDQVVDPVDLGDGWAAADCPGEAPLVCLTRNGIAVGHVERMAFPIADPPRGDGGDLAWLFARAEAFATGLAADRRLGCGEDYVLEFAPHDAVWFGGVEGVRYAFTGSLADGTVVERGVAFLAIEGHHQEVLAANAYAEGGCLAAEGAWTVDGLAAAEPVLELLAARSQRLGAERASGMVFGRLLEAEGGRIVVDTVEFLTGDEAERAAREDGQHRGPDGLPNDVYVRDRVRDELVLAMTPELRVDLVDCDAGCQPVEVDAAAWYAGEATPFNGPGALYALTVHVGRLVHIAEQYLP